MTAATKHRPHPKPQVAPGYLVINISGAAGGVSYTRERVATRSRHGAKSTTFMNVKHEDHAAFVHEINEHVKKVDCVILRGRCVKTSFGHFVSEAGVDALRRDVAGLRDKVDDLNRAAMVAGSDHRGRVGVVIATLDVDQPEVVTECSRAIAEVLVAFRDALRAGDIDDVTVAGKVIKRNAIKPLFLRAKNVETLMIGATGGAITAALDRVRTARAEIRAGVSADKVDLSAIEAALGWFS